MIKRILNITLLLCIGSTLIHPNAYAKTYVFEKESSKIEGSIKYTMIGRYRAVFNEYEGYVEYDEKRKEIKSLLLKIDAKSIQSNFKTLDLIIRSGRLLNTAKYPHIIFKSKNIVKTADGYRAVGTLDLHGVKQTLNFPFKYEINEEGKLEARGSWTIKRKGFNIIWHHKLDRGGVLVGDIITVNWRVVAR